MVGSITNRKKRELAKKGLSTGQIDHMDAVVKAAPSGMAPNPPMDKDSLMMQPTENWSKVDRKGKWGDSVLSYPSRKFRERYDLVDWSK